MRKKDAMLLYHVELSLFGSIETEAPLESAVKGGTGLTDVCGGRLDAELRGCLFRKTSRRAPEPSDDADVAGHVHGLLREVAYDA